MTEKKIAAGMSILDFSKSRGIEPIVIGHLIKDGYLSFIRKGSSRIDPEKADEALKIYGNPNSEASESVGSFFTDDLDELPSISESKQISEAYKAKLAQLEYESKIGVMIEREKVKKSLFVHHRRVRDRLLALPDRVTALIAGHSSAEQSEIRNLLFEEVQDCCNELANPVSYTDFEEDDGPEE